MINDLNIQLSLVCNTDECLSFIIVFLNLLTIFYLVYSSYKKFTNITKIFGYVWSCFIMCASVVILAIHTCIFTIGGVVFTGMAIIAVLSMIFEHQKEEKQSGFEVKKKDAGCYVVFPTNDNKFVFGLHNKQNQLLALSTYKYNSVEEAKEGILYSRTSGEGCEFENLTLDWVIDAKHPKFKMYLNNQKYFFEFAVSETITMLRSEAIEEASECLRMVKQARRCVTSSVIYLSTAQKDIRNGKEFKLYSSSHEAQNENFNDEPEAMSLAESFAEMKNSRSSSFINKQTLYDYLNGRYGHKVILNRRDNLTSTGLPLADTYYTYSMQKDENGKDFKKKVCFAYVFENEGSCLILARLDAEYAKALAKNKKSITLSKFPKAKTNDWYSVIANDTFTEDEIYNILNDAKEYCEK